MSRNGSGVYVLPAGNPVVSGTTINSSVQNATMTDIANALTTSVATDGQTPMAANLPMGGNKITGLAAATLAGDAARLDQVQAIIPAGTNMLFQQTAAPVGWTKQTTHNDKALRVVSGTASSGGANAFSASIGSGAFTSDPHALTTAELAVHSHPITDQTHGHTNTDPGHTHGIAYSLGGGGSAIPQITGTSNGVVSFTGSDNINGSGITVNASLSNISTTNNAGSGSGHTHNIALNVQYVDIIICQKN